MKWPVIGAAFAAVIIFGIWWLLFRVPPGTEVSPAEQAFDVLTGLQAVEKKAQADKDLALVRAKELFRQKLLEGADLSSGPCLAEELIPSWVADIAHDPRIPEDDLSENQCLAYREGRAQHFIELDPLGNVIQFE